MQLIKKLPVQALPAPAAPADPHNHANHPNCANYEPGLIYDPEQSKSHMSLALFNKSDPQYTLRLVRDPQSLIHS